MPGMAVHHPGADKEETCDMPSYQRRGEVDALDVHPIPSPKGGFTDPDVSSTDHAILKKPPIRKGVREGALWSYRSTRAARSSGARRGSGAPEHESLGAAPHPRQVGGRRVEWSPCKSSITASQNGVR